MVKSSVNILLFLTDVVWSGLLCNTHIQYTITMLIIIWRMLLIFVFKLVRVWEQWGEENIWQREEVEGEYRRLNNEELNNL